MHFDRFPWTTNCSNWGRDLFRTQFDRRLQINLPPARAIRLSSIVLAAFTSTSMILFNILSVSISAFSFFEPQDMSFGKSLNCGMQNLQRCSKKHCNGDMCILHWKLCIHNIRVIPLNELNKSEFQSDWQTSAIFFVRSSYTNPRTRD